VAIKFIANGCVMSEKKSSEIARETLKQLTVRMLAPTPANYQSVYNEIAGISCVPHFPLDRLRDIARSLPAHTSGQEKQRGLLEYAVDCMSWDGVKTALMAYGGFVTVATTESVAVDMGGASALTADFMTQIGLLIEYCQPALGTDDERFNEQTEMMIKALRQSGADIATIKTMLVNYCHRLSFVAEDQSEIKTVLLKLLHMVFENIADLSPDEQWLRGQMESLVTASEPPLTLRRLDDVERRLKDVIFNQKEARDRAILVQNELRDMLKAFVERLSEITQSTGSFHEKLEESARLIEQAKSMAEIAPLLKEVVGATRTMASDSKIARNELIAMREHADLTEAEIVKLHQELDRVSAEARHDSLTGALNRKGLDEALERELSTVRRKETPLCLALLDIDDFKKLNDTFGHARGDEALNHLASVARECMRPQDTLARFGGEEFVILLPDTPLDRGIDALTRLQRELTKHIFMVETEKVLITFSAGVAQLIHGEVGQEAILRADQAMYLAKRAGKNCVLAA
jgi:diguanylate cyclase